MGPENLIATVEAGLLQILRWGLAWRFPAVADLAALVAASVAHLPQWALVFCTAEGVLYEWDKDSQATEVPPQVLKSATLAPAAFGRWVRLTSALTYGAGGVLLRQKQSGYLRAIESWESDDGIEATIERVSNNLPGVLLQFVGDDPKSANNTPGTFYLDRMRFRLVLQSQNLRGEPHATIGPRLAAEIVEDPGIYRIAGDLRRLLGGVSFASGIPSVERIEPGALELAFEDEDRRIQVWTMDLVVKASFDITDEDLEAAAIRVMPHLTDHWPRPTWDKLNYVGTGGGLDVGAGPGLARTLEATLGVVGGVAVTSAAQLVTFAASSDTYRYLDQAGAWSFAAVAAESAAPATPAGLLCVAVTRTDGSGVVWDRALCSFSVAFPPGFDVPS